MNKKVIMNKFIKMIEQEKLLTLFIANIFDYEDFHDYNYIFRMIDDSKRIILDIYDNISDNRFNRYIFSFTKGDNDIRVEEEHNIFVTYINVLSVNDCNNKLLKFAYLFTIRKSKMVEYSQSFLDDKIVNILAIILSKPI